MEAVGRLAGGIAHDFNNVLSVILSYSDLILTELEAPNPLASDVGEIRKAALRAAELTRQLLVFSRQQVIAPKVLDLNEVVFAVDRMTARILGEDIELVFSPGAGLGRVQADRNNVEQVIMNLVVNARDAMPTGGKLDDRDRQCPPRYRVCAGAPWCDARPARGARRQRHRRGHG